MFMKILSPLWKDIHTDKVTIQKLRLPIPNVRQLVCYTPIKKTKSNLQIRRKMTKVILTLAKTEIIHPKNVRAKVRMDFT